MTDDIIGTIHKNAREEIRVSLGEFNGHQLLNLRVWFEAEDGSMRPGKSGLAFRVDRLEEFHKTIGHALVVAKRKGLV